MDRLAALSLSRPVRVRLDPTMRVASGIQQEFVKIKENRENDRDAMLLGTAQLFLAQIGVLCTSDREVGDCSKHSARAL